MLWSDLFNCSFEDETTFQSFVPSMRALTMTMITSSFAIEEFQTARKISVSKGVSNKQ